MPLPAASVDVVISNCVINLSTDKPRVFAEIARVLRPGGRMSVSDVVADDASLRPTEPPGAIRRVHRGALSFSEYAAGLAAAGLAGIEIQPTHAAVPGMYNALVRAVRPSTHEDADTADAAARAAAAGLAAARVLPTDGTVTLGDACCVPDGGSSCCGPAPGGHRSAHSETRAAAPLPRQRCALDARGHDPDAGQPVAAPRP